MTTNRTERIIKRELIGIIGETEMKSISNYILGVCFLLAVIAQTSFGQLTEVVPVALAQEVGSNGQHSISNLEALNLYSGTLDFKIPLIATIGRGDATFHPNVVVKQIWDAFDENQVFPLISAEYFMSAQSGVLYQRANNGKQIYFIFHAPDGSEIYLRDKLYQGQLISSGTSRGRIFESINGEGITFISDVDVDNFGNIQDYYWPSVSYGWLRFKNGTTYRIENSLITSIFDRNGNAINFTYEEIETSPTLPPDYRVSKITDSLGREVEFLGEENEGGQYGNCNKITYKGTAADERTMRVCYNSLGSLLRSGQSLQTQLQLFPELEDGQSSNYNPQRISAVWLQNGQKYQFQYNSYGEIARVVLPTGAAFEYDFAAGVTGGYASGVIRATYLNESRYKIYRRLIERREYPDGASGSSYTLKTTFSRPESVTNSESTSGSNLGYIDVEQSDQSGTVSFVRNYYYGSARQSFEHVIGAEYPAWKDGQMYKVESFATDKTTVLVRSLLTYQQKAAIGWWSGNADLAPPNDPRLVETVTELLDVSPKLVKKSTYIDPNNSSNIGYDQYNNPTDVWVYDWGQNSAGSFLRREHNTYVTSSSYTDDTITTFRPHLRNLISESWTSSDISGNDIVSRTQYEYDNYSTSTGHAAIVDRSSVTGRYSFPNVIDFGSGYSTRGNPTKATRYADADGQTGAISTYAQYDILGNVVVSIDGNANATTINYSDNFGTADSNATTNSTPSQISGYSTFAFPTSTTKPYPSNWTSYVQYDYFTGQPVNSQDFNGIISKTIYNDDLDRPTQTVANVGITGKEIQTTIEYDDANRRVEKTSDLFTLNDNLARAESYYDGLGRTIETRDYKDGDYVSVKTEYDPLGRVYRTSNPYRPSRSESLLWTENTFDALGRVTEIETPDAAQVKTAYDGNRTLVADQAGKKRISKTNALGQLTDVWEITTSDGSTVSVSFPGSLGSGVSYGYQTSYGYDVLGNLVHVDQGTQDRDFVYDSLSRLTSATNPESGTITYTYDSNGNIKTRRDARNIKTVYDYDALNRVTERCYRSIGSGSLGMTTCVSNNETAEPNTPDVNYTYEDTNVTSLKGVLTEVTNGTSTSEYTSFDAIGRITGHKQTTDSVQYTTGYSYYLSGALNEETYPSGRVVKNVFDTADGSLSQVQSKRSGDTFRNYANTFVYNATGAVTAVHLGNGRWQNTTYNSRRQVTKIGLGSGPASQNILKLEYSYGDWVSGSVDSTKNNGNIAKQVITVPSVGANNGFTATQKYYYDSLNRIDDATEEITSETWRQDFSYDRYGNRTFVAANTTTLPKNCLEESTPTFCTSDIPAYNPTISTTNNRFSSGQGYSYDNSGNTTADAADWTFVYDGENKQVEVKDDDEVTVGQYYYDSGGKRVKKYVPGTGETTIFVYDATGRQVAEYSTIVQTGSDARITYTTNDSLGSPRINTDGVGQVIARHDYRPFGEEISTSARISALGYSTDTTRKKFTGYERDGETGLDFAEARYFNSKFGRFTVPDYFAKDFSPVAPQSLNLYAYVRNNPLAYSDSSGTELNVIVDGKAYKVIKDGGVYKLEGNDGSNATVVAGERYLNRLGENFRSEINTLIDKNSTRISIADDGRNYPGGITYLVDQSGAENQVNSSVGISLGNDDESFVAFATEVLVANLLIYRTNPSTPNDSERSMTSTQFFQSGQMYANQAVLGAPSINIFTDGSQLSSFDQARNDLETNVRNLYGIGPREHLQIWTPPGVSAPLDLDKALRKVQPFTPRNIPPETGQPEPPPNPNGCGSSGRNCN